MHANLVAGPVYKFVGSGAFYGTFCIRLADIFHIASHGRRTVPKILGAAQALYVRNGHVCTGCLDPNKTGWRPGIVDVGVMKAGNHHAEGY